MWCGVWCGGDDDGGGGDGGGGCLVLSAQVSLKLGCGADMRC